MDAIAAIEPHFTPEDIAEAWRCSAKTVHRIFQDQPGVLKISTASRRRGQRGKTLLRIPRSVLERVHLERTS